MYVAKHPKLQGGDNVWIIARTDVRSIIIYHYAPYSPSEVTPPADVKQWKEFADTGPMEKVLLRTKDETLASCPFPPLARVSQQTNQTNKKQAQKTQENIMTNPYSSPEVQDT